MTIIRYYHTDKNPDEAMLPGVPLRDLEEDEFDNMLEWLQNSIDDSGFWTKTDTTKKKPASAAKDEVTDASS